MHRARLFVLFCFLAAFTSVGACPEPSALGDEFDNEETLSGWKIFSETEKWPSRIVKLDVNETEKGHLFLEPTFGGWWKGYHGSFVYKEVKGDFIITAKLMVKGKNTPLPTVPWNRGGILIRKPGDLSIKAEERKEDLVHIMTGVNSNKDFTVYSGDSRQNVYKWLDTAEVSQKESVYVELGILKDGEVFLSFYRFGNRDWKVFRRIRREDLKDAPLQIGLTGCAEPYDKTGTWLNDRYSAYEFNKEVLPSELPADVRMYVDYFRVRRVDLGEKNRAYIREWKPDFQAVMDMIKAFM